jgi:rsbT co-antagonist protein RsbR
VSLNITERKLAEERIQQQTKEIMDLSTPVMQVWQGVVVAPLIGSLDSQRTQQFMERLLARIVETNSPVALVDIMGVATIDTQTAQHLIETISAVRLLGAQVVLTGVRPTIAQTLVHLGVDLSGIITRSSLAGGLLVALDILDLKISAKNGSH